MPLKEVERRRTNVADRAHASGNGAGDESVPDHDDAVAPVDRHAGVEERADEREIAGAERDGDRHAPDRDEREPWILREHPQPELHIEPRDFHQRTPFFSRALRQQDGCARLAYPRGVAEPLRRRVTGRFRTHAARNIVPRPLLQMESKLLVNFALGILVHRCPPVAGSSVEVTARLTALESRSQPLACSSNSRSPAAVSR